jgi:hypothetical protein
MPRGKGKRKAEKAQEENLAQNSEVDGKKSDSPSPNEKSPNANADDTIALQVIKNHIPSVSNKELKAIQAYCAKNEISTANKWQHFLNTLKPLGPERQMLFLDKMNILETTKVALMARLKPEKDSDASEPDKKKPRLNGPQLSTAQGEDSSEELLFGDVSNFLDNPDSSSALNDQRPTGSNSQSADEPEQYYFHGSVLRTASTEDEFDRIPDSFVVNHPLLNYKFCRELEPKAREIKQHAAMLFNKHQPIPKNSFVKSEIVGNVRVLYDVQEKLKLLVAEDILDYTRKSSVLVANPLSNDEWKQLKERYNLLKKAKAGAGNGSKRCYRCSGHGHLWWQCKSPSTRAVQWDKEHKRASYQQHQQPYQQHHQPYQQQQQQFFRPQQRGFAGREGVQTYDRRSDK